MSDDEGYSCRLWRGGSWVICDRYSELQLDHPSFEGYEQARDYADQLNEGVIARRFGRAAPPLAAKPATGRVKARVKAVDRASKPLMGFADALEALDLF